MINYFLYGTTVLFCVFMYKIEAFHISGIAIKKGYAKWRSLNKVTAQTNKNKNKLSVQLISAKMVLSAIYISMLQYMNASVRKYDRKVYEISYTLNGRLYKMLVKPKRGPIPILQISDDEQNDVTDFILPYMGPQYDWHGNTYNPKFFGHKSLTFELSDGTEHTYGEDDNVYGGA